MAIETYVDQSARDLNLSVVTGALELEQFNLLASDHRETEFGAFGAHIIGGSHIVVLNFNGKRIHEVFACMDFNAAEASHVAKFGKFANLVRGAKMDLVGGIRYRFQTEMMSLANDDTRRRIDRFAAVKSGEKLVHLAMTFPKLKEEDFPPTTIVMVQNPVLTQEVIVHSLHSYPNEGLAVFTESRFSGSRAFL